MSTPTYVKPNATQQVLALIEQAGPDGLTDREIAEALGGTGREQMLKYAKRRLDLQHLGLVRKAKTRRLNEGTGRYAKVWVAT